MNFQFAAFGSILVGQRLEGKPNTLAHVHHHISKVTSNDGETQLLLSPNSWVQPFAL
jgi:hypothetical protein